MSLPGQGPPFPFGDDPAPQPLAHHQRASAHHPQQPQSIEQHVEGFPVGSKQGFQPFPLMDRHQGVGLIPAPAPPILQGSIGHPGGGGDHQGRQHERRQGGVGLSAAGQPGRRAGG